MSEHKLAQIIHRTAKMLVSLLEKEYGCGAKQQNRPELETRRVFIVDIDRPMQ